MAIKPLEDDHHVVRHVPPARLRRDEDDNVIGFNPQAFELNRAKDEEYLSAAWLEYYGHETRELDLAAVVDDFRKVKQIKPSHRFAVGNVKIIKDACANWGQQVRVSHEPVDDFDSHASVRRFNSDNYEMLEMLAAEAWAEMVSA